MQCLTSVHATDPGVCCPCSRVHDRTISQVRYLPEEGLLVALALDNTMRIFNAQQATVKRTVVNDTGGPFTGMEHDPTRSQVIQPFHVHGTALYMHDTAL